MKRPLAVTGFVYLAASAAAVFLGQGVLLPAGAVMLLGLAMSLKCSRTRRNGAVPLALITALAAFAAVGLYNNAKIVPAEKLAGKQAVINAELCELPYQRYGQYYYTVNALELKSRDGSILHDVKLLVYADEPLEFSPSDIITADVRISRTHNSYDRSKGIIYRAFLPYPQTVRLHEQEHKPLYYYILKMRYGICQRIERLLPDEEAAFVKAFLMGDSYSFDDDTVSSLRAAGLSHIIVVSGLHVAVIVNILMLLFVRIMRMKKRRAAVICSAVLLLYMAVSGFSPSVVRAGIMQIIPMLCAFAFRRSDPFAALGAALLMILIAKPYAAADISLLLSFSATLGILLIQRPMAVRISKGLFRVSRGRRKNRLLISAGAVILDAFTVTLSAVIFALPVTVLYFRQVPAYSVVSSMLTSFALPFLMGSVLIMLVLDISFVLSFLAVPAAFVTGLLTRQILFTADIVSGLPFAYIQLYWGFVPLWVILCAALAAVLYLRRNMRHRIRLFALTAALTFMVGYAANYLVQRDTVTILVPQVGQGVTVMIRNGNDSFVIACGGENSYTQSAVHELCLGSEKSIEYLLLPGKDKEVSRFAENILRDISVDAAGIYDERSYSASVRQALDKCGKVLRYNANDGKIRSIGQDGCVIESLRAYRICAVYVHIKSCRVLLCCDGTDCAGLPEEWLSTDILIVNGELKNTGLLSYDTLIISDREKYSDITYREIDSDGSALRTYMDGSITLKI